MSQIFVSLDIETTGLDPENNEIIEIAAVKFDNEQILDTFHTVVNPYCIIPYRIRMLTHITQAEVDSAPPLSQIGDGLVSFIAAYPVVGHNPAFDLGFLSTKGFHLSNPSYDTFELGSLLFPQLSDYSLSSVTSHLQLSSPVFHRALPDATVTKDVFLTLLDRILQLDLSLLTDMSRLTDIDGWSLHSLFLEVLEEKTKSVFPIITKTSTEPLTKPYSSFTSPEQKFANPLTPSSTKKPLELENLTSILTPGGVLEKAFPTYECRPGQLSMMQAIIEAFNQDHHLIVEAGTGTGKSMAYLLPAVYFALSNSTPIVISTNTINLQEQLISKDIPELLQVLNSSAYGLRAMALKGRENYFCLRRWNSFRLKPELSREEAMFIIRSLVWLTFTVNGDRAEIHLLWNEYSIWSKVCAIEDDCLGEKCEYHKNNRCFLYRARRQAQSAHIIIINHALLLSDLVASSQILPSFTHLIIDEAHHLEAAATEHLGFKITSRDIFDHLDQFQPGSNTSFITNLRNRLRGGSVAPQRKLDIDQLVNQLEKSVEASRGWTSMFFTELTQLLQSNTKEPTNYESSVRFTPKVRHTPIWPNVEWSWQNLSQSLEDTENGLNQLYDALEGLETKIQGYEDFRYQLSSQLHINRELQQRINSIISRPEPNRIHWCHIKKETKAQIEGIHNLVTLHSAPLDAGVLLNKLLFSQKDCVIVTSATLTTGGDFHYITEGIGLMPETELIVGAPFDYQASTMIYILDDIPQPASPGYQQGVEQALIKLCRATRGRTLALFTSHAALKATHASIRASLEEEDILLLGQGIDGNPRQLLSALKTNPRVVLLGTSSLWEGIDVVGEALSVLVIARLPFSVPTEPIFAARSELFTDPFNEYAVPQAVLKFKQGFGRLIRSRTDRGVAVILDHRIQRKAYGTTFIKSLPPCTVKRGPIKTLPREVTDWLGKAVT